MQYFVDLIFREMVSFSSLTTVLDNNLPTFRLDALVVLKANDGGPQFIATSSLAGARHC